MGSLRNRVFNSPKAFTVLLGITMCIYTGCIGSYSTATITTVQQQFQFKSTEIGVLLTVNDVVGIFMVTITAYFGGSRNRPRILGYFTLLFAVACVVSTISQFTKHNPIDEQVDNSSSSSEMCRLNSDPVEDQCTDEEEKAAGAQHLKAIWLYIGQALFGIASSGYFSLGISYLDDGVSKAVAPLYIAAVFIVAGLGSFVSYGLSAISLSLHVDFYKINVNELGYDESDPQWIGAWWLGYLAFAGIFVIISIPFFFFPKEWPHKNDLDELADKEISKHHEMEFVNGMMHRSSQTDHEGVVEIDGAQREIRPRWRFCDRERCRRE